MNKILTISSTIYAAIGTGFLVFASFFINVTKKLAY